MGVTASQRRVIANMVLKREYFPDVTARHAVSLDIGPIGLAIAAAELDRGNPGGEGLIKQNPDGWVFAFLQRRGCGVERHHANKPRIMALAIGLSLALTTQVQAGGGGGIVGATEPTQILNNVELGLFPRRRFRPSLSASPRSRNQAAQIANQIQQIQNMVTNTLNIPNQVWGQIQQEIAPLLQVVQQGQAIAYRWRTSASSSRCAFRTSTTG